jgi:hypothetical protein
MYQYRIVFYGKYRRPLVIFNCRADSNEEALEKAKANPFEKKGIRGYTMQKTR